MTFTRLKRRKREKFGMRQETRIRCPSHLAWVRGHVCAVWDKFCWGNIEAAHVRSGTDGGAARKPSDCWVIPLCGHHHSRQHAIGEPEFEKRYAIDMQRLAMQLWQRSPARIKYEQRIRERKERTA